MGPEEKSSSGKLMLVELNEFDPEFLRSTADRLGLKNIQRCLGMARATSTTDDRIEHQGLDPWVQWVNVHTGKPSSAHGVLRLGQTTRQTDAQIWSVLGNAGKTWGAWGVMNAPRQNAPGCQFFFPDPWSFEEQAYPEHLNQLLALPRYMAKNYLDVDRSKALMEAWKFVAGLMTPSLWKATAQFSTTALARAGRHGLNVHALATLLDYLSTLAFVSLRQKTRPDFSVIFLNNIAHLQHQFWHQSELHHEMEFGIRLSDKMLGHLLQSRRPGEAIILMNGLKQKNVEGEGFCVYRQKNPQAMIDRLGVSGKVEQCMTHDAHVIFADTAAADHGEAILRNCKLASGAVAFYAERVAPDRVFYQIDFQHRIPADEEIRFGNQSIPAAEVIELYAVRTGAHVPEGDIFYDGVDMPKQLHNHEVAKVILDYFERNAAKGPHPRQAA